MNPNLRIILFVVLGIVGGSVANMLVLQLGEFIVPLPPGADVSSTEGLNTSMALMTPIDFLFPFLAHAVGTLVGSYVATRWSKASTMLPAMIVAVFFLLGGIYMIVQIPNTPVWFTVVDLVGAYLPMGYLAYISVKVPGDL